MSKADYQVARQKVGSIYPKGCSQFVCEVLGVAYKHQRLDPRWSGWQVRPRCWWRGGLERTTRARGHLRRKPVYLCPWLQPGCQDQFYTGQAAISNEILMIDPLNLLINVLKAPVFPLRRDNKDKDIKMDMAIMIEVSELICFASPQRNID